MRHLPLWPCGAKVVPAAPRQAGFDFAEPCLDPALRRMLGDAETRTTRPAGVPIR